MFYVEPIPAPDGSEIECGKEFVGMKPRPLINMSDSVCVIGTERENLDPPMHCVIWSEQVYGSY